MVEKGKQFLLKVILPLFLGSLIYYIFFPEVWFVGKIDSLVGSWQRVSLKRTFLPVLFRNYFMDFLWAFSLCNAVSLIVGKNKKIVLLSTLGLGALLEILQWTNVISGTGDIADVLVELLGGMTAIIFDSLFKKFKKEKGHEL